MGKTIPWLVSVSASHGPSRELCSATWGNAEHELRHSLQWREIGKGSKHCWEHPDTRNSGKPQAAQGKGTRGGNRHQSPGAGAVEEDTLSGNWSAEGSQLLSDTSEAGRKYSDPFPPAFFSFAGDCHCWPSPAGSPLARESRTVHSA